METIWIYLLQLASIHSLQEKFIHSLQVEKIHCKKRISTVQIKPEQLKGVSCTWLIEARILIKSFDFSAFSISDLN